MTTLVCRLGNRRAVIRTRRDVAPRPLYLGAVVDLAGRPARRVEINSRGARIMHEAPIRLSIMTATGLCELLVCLDHDAEVYAA